VRPEDRVEENGSRLLRDPAGVVSMLSDASIREADGQRSLGPRLAIDSTWRNRFPFAHGDARIRTINRDRQTDQLARSTDRPTPARVSAATASSDVAAVVQLRRPREGFPVHPSEIADRRLPRRRMSSTARSASFHDSTTRCNAIRGGPGARPSRRAPSHPPILRAAR